MADPHAPTRMQYPIVHAIKADSLQLGILAEQPAAAPSTKNQLANQAASAPTPILIRSNVQLVQVEKDGDCSRQHAHLRPAHRHGSRAAAQSVDGDTEDACRADMESCRRRDWTAQGRNNTLQKVREESPWLHDMHGSVLSMHACMHDIIISQQSAACMLSAANLLDFHSSTCIKHDIKNWYCVESEFNTKQTSMIDNVACNLVLHHHSLCVYIL